MKYESLVTPKSLSCKDRRHTPSSFQTPILPPPPGVDPTSATQDIFQRVQAAKADQPSSCQIRVRSLANARSVAGESTSLPGSTARSPRRLQQSQEALCCQSQDYPGDTALAPPYQASRNDIPTIPQATRHIGNLQRGIEEQREPGQSPRLLYPTQAQHTLSQINIQVQTPKMYSQWKGQQLVKLAETYERHAPDFWEEIAHEVDNPSNVCEVKFLASRANPIAHKCPQCHRTFTRRADLKRHCDSHAQGGFLCPARDGCRVFKRRDNLWSHLKPVHSWVLPKQAPKNPGPEDAGQVYAEEQVHEGGQILIEQNPNLYLAATAPSKRRRPEDEGPIGPAAEDAEIARLRGSGEEWIDVRLPGRGAFKLHYPKHIKYEWDEEKRTRLETLYERYGYERPEIWKAIGAVLGIPWRACEAMHWAIARRANTIAAADAAQGDATSRRRSMTIQDMLNPSDEEARQSPQTTLS